MHDVTFSAVQSREGTYWHGEAFPPPSVKFGFGLVGNWGVYTQCVDQSSASTVVFGKISVFGNLKPYNEKKKNNKPTVIKTPQPQIRGVSICSLSELQLNNLLVVIFASLSH